MSTVASIVDAATGLYAGPWRGRATKPLLRAVQISLSRHSINQDLCTFTHDGVPVTALTTRTTEGVLFFSGDCAMPAFDLLRGAVDQTACLLDAVALEHRLPYVDGICLHAVVRQCAADDDPPMDFPMPGTRRAVLFDALKIVAYRILPEVLHVWDPQSGPEQIERAQQTWPPGPLRILLWGSDYQRRTALEHVDLSTT